MKKALLLASLLAFCAAATAQAGNTFGLGLEGRYWQPDQLEKFTEDDSLLGGALRLQFGLGQYLALDLSAGAMGAWDEVTIRYADGWTDKYDVDLYVMPVQAGLRARVPVTGCLDLVLGGGAGYYWVRGEVSNHYDPYHHRHHEYDDFDLGSDIGYYALAGFDITLAQGISIYGECRYDWLKFDVEDEAKLFADDVGAESELTFDGIGAAVGLRFSF